MRTHPAQPYEFVKSLQDYTKINPLVTISYPEKEFLDEYFRKCDVLVSGNSSIHLEAAVSGLVTYYYEFSNETSYYDYYGYIKTGLCEIFPENLKLLNVSVINNLQINDSSSWE